MTHEMHSNHDLRNAIFVTNHDYTKNARANRHAIVHACPAAKFPKVAGAVTIVAIFVAGDFPKQQKVVVQTHFYRELYTEMAQPPPYNQPGYPPPSGDPPAYPGRSFFILKLFLIADVYNDKIL